MCGSRPSEHLVLQVFSRAFNVRTIKKGGQKVGCEVGKPLNRDAVLIERGPEIFRSIVEASDTKLEDKASSVVLEKPRGYQKALAKTPCERCGALLTAAYMLCDRCGERNTKYSERVAILEGRVKRKFERQPEVPPIIEAIVKNTSIEDTTRANKWMGDLIGQMDRHSGGDLISAAAKHGGEEDPPTKASEEMWRAQPKNQKVRQPERLKMRWRQLWRQTQPTNRK